MLLADSCFKGLVCSAVLKAGELSGDGQGLGRWEGFLVLACVCSAFFSGHHVNTCHHRHMLPSREQLLPQGPTIVRAL